MDSHCSKDSERAQTVDTGLGKVADRWGRCEPPLHLIPPRFLSSFTSLSHTFFPVTEDVPFFPLKKLQRSAFSSGEWESVCRLCYNHGWLKACLVEIRNTCMYKDTVGKTQCESTVHEKGRRGGGGTTTIVMSDRSPTNGLIFTRRYVVRVSSSTCLI